VTLTLWNISFIRPRPVSGGITPGAAPIRRVLRQHLAATVLMLAASLSAVFPALGASPEALFSGGDPKAPWHIFADEVNYDQKSEKYVASGNVIITRGDVRITGDLIRFDHRRSLIEAEGRVSMSAGADILTGSRIEMNLEAQTGTLYGGSVFLAENHFYIRGNKIRKVGKETYTADTATVTSCDGDRPAWKITGRNLDITLEGYGTIHHAALWAGKVPVFYSPLLVFPVKLKRQTGFLTPQIGLSERKGFEINQPLFWAINDSTDATFYGDYMTERGGKAGGEYRYILDRASFGTAMADYLNDQKVDDGLGDHSRKWGYEDDAYLRPNSDRYWVRMKHDQALPYGFSGKLDLDVVSDQDYLQEFKSGYSGFEETRAYFLNVFGREIDDFTEVTRVHRLNLNRIWAQYSLNAEARWNDNVVNRTQKDADDTLQSLPRVQFDGSKQPLFQLPVYFDFNTEYDHLYRQTGTRGNRIDLYPRFYYPYRFRNYFSFEPSIGLRETAWYINEYDNKAVDRNSAFHRESYDLKLDLSTEVFRLYSAPASGVDRIKHQARFQVVYDYLPDQAQGELPYFDALDRIEKTNLVTYSLTNTFTSRSMRKPAPAPETGGQPAVASAPYDYNAFGRLKVYQSYDINKGNADAAEPFSPVTAELELTPLKYLYLKGDAAFSAYGGGFVSHSVATRLSDTRGDQIFAEYRYARDTLESLYVEGAIGLTDALSLVGAYEQNLLTRTNLSTGVGVVYKAQCWALDVRYREENQDRQIAFTINLFGLGGVGSGVGLGGR
jgi:LPS-assembly protein